MKIKSGIGNNSNNSSDYKPLSSSLSKNQLVVFDREYKNSLTTNNNAPTTGINPFKIKDYKNNSNIKFPSINPQDNSCQVPLSGSNSFLTQDTSISFAAVRSGYKVELSEKGKEAIQKLNKILSISQNEITKKELLRQELSSFYRATLGRKVTRALAFSI